MINSPLVKTAVFGNDPNVGRILMAVGDYAGNNGISIRPQDTSISICGYVVYRNGSFDLNAEKEDLVSRALKETMLKTAELGYPAHDRCVHIGIRVGAGPGYSEVIGSDLSYEYVRENADYRT